VCELCRSLKQTNEMSKVWSQELWLWPKLDVNVNCDQAIMVIW
jgi:hypothetical protein